MVASRKEEMRNQVFDNVINFFLIAIDLKGKIFLFFTYNMRLGAKSSDAKGTALATSPGPELCP
jgi:hypothetical protein